jgi:8-oxo-dGTP diphosphatase
VIDTAEDLMTKGGTRAPRSQPGNRETEFLESYRVEDYPRPSVTVDVVILTVQDSVLKVLLVERTDHPFRGHWSLPGGFLRVGDARSDRGEDLDGAARRIVVEKTGLPAGRVFSEQLYTFGAVDRDPRMRVLTVAYYALVRPDLVPFVESHSGATAAIWLTVDEASKRPLAFDHAAILRTAVERIRGKIDYTDIAFELVAPTFTIAEMRSVHEAIKGTAYDPGNFRRRFQRMLTDGIITKAPGRRATASKPAQVFSFSQRTTSSE